MKAQPKSIFNLLTLFALLISLLGSAAAFSPAHAALPANLPTGLTAADWSQIEALLPPTQQTYIKASNTEANDSFGISMDISGDTLVVGAIFEDSNATGVNGNQADNSATDSGAAYVFTRNGTTWSQQAYLKASNTNPNDWFGASVAISGDTLVVGAFFEDSNATGINGNQADNSATNSSAAYVFTCCRKTWSQPAYLKTSNTQAGDYFGKGSIN
ncbi:MAG: FG-GAP repeat protein [Anaerolineales bacterium]|nr:FG-GAP repeat protein [Anaerolineales bacterium]